MKKSLILIITTALSAVLSLFGMNYYLVDENYALPELWTKYFEAEDADHPILQLSMLDKIRKTAFPQKLWWDWWDASVRNVDVQSRRNWKLRDSLVAELGTEVESTGEPLLKFNYMDSFGRASGLELVDFVLAHKEALSATRQTSMYGNSSYRIIGNALGGCLDDYIANDYELLLWEVAGRVEGFRGEAPACKALLKTLAGAYPAAAYLQYRIAMALDDKAMKRAELEKLAGRYHSRAVGILARTELLYLKKEDLEADPKVSSEDFKALRGEFKACLNDMWALDESEGEILSSYHRISDAISELERRGLSVFVHEGIVDVFFQNLANATLTLRRENDTIPVFKTKVLNEVKSFYINDTVEVKLPVLDDGRYTVEATMGKLAGEDTFELYHLSLAGRWADGRFGAYVTDYKSGKPYGKVDLTLMKNGTQVASVRDFPLGEGFTDLPESFHKLLKGSSSSWELRASLSSPEGTKYLSRNIWLGSLPRDGENSDTLSTALVFTDKGAYNPGETVHFKALLYGGDPYESYTTLPQGVSVKVQLYDAQDNEIDSKALTTNDFGSVAGSFTIPSGLRGGRFSIVARSEAHVGRTDFRVDEFRLPSFEVNFKDLDRVYFPGDTLRVYGNVVSYSGHSLSAAKATFRASERNRLICEGEVALSSDGTFCVEIPTDPKTGRQTICLNVKVTDGTGETAEYTFWATVSKYQSIGIDLLNAGEGKVERLEGYVNTKILNGDIARLKLSLFSSSTQVPGELHYTLSVADGKAVKSKAPSKPLTEGTAKSGETFSIDLSSYPSGLYTLFACYGDRATAQMDILRLAPDTDTIAAPIQNFFLALDEKVASEGKVEALLCCPRAELWAVAEVFGPGATVLEREFVHLHKAGELYRFSTAYKPSWPKKVALRFFFFLEADQQEWESEFTQKENDLALPLEFTRFEDKTTPGDEVEIGVKTHKGVECLASVYDKSTDSVEPNNWYTVSLLSKEIDIPYISSKAGSVRENRAIENEAIPFSLRRSAPKYGNFATKSVYQGDMFLAMSAPMADSAAEEAEPEPVSIRVDFATTLSFEPFLRSDAEGNISFSFKTSDKLSTFWVSLFAHNQSMHNAVLRRDFKVTIPVKVSIEEPSYLYVGDKYRASVSVSSNTDGPLQGTLYLYQYDSSSYEGREPDFVKSVKLTVPSLSSVAAEFEVEVPQNSGDIGLKAVFVSEGFSDGVFVSIPVRAASQSLTEAHSAILLSETSREAVLERLRASFVNTTAVGAKVEQRSILDMVNASIPTYLEPASDNLTDLVDTYYMRLLAEKLGAKLSPKLSTEKLLSKILACRNADGGFAWFEGFSSSPMLTAWVLERFAKLTSGGYMEPLDLEGSVKFLDENQVRGDWPRWCGGVSADQYLLVRARYSGVLLTVEPVTAAQKKRFSEFKDYVKDYLIPKKDRGLQGEILRKARRLMTLELLMSSEDGLALSQALGLGSNIGAKLRKSFNADVLSLMDYAVEHPDGGVYYPNAVMPLRGLMESEAYAHALLCDLFSSLPSKSAGSTSSSLRDVDSPATSSLRGMGSSATSSLRGTEGPVAISNTATHLADGIRIYLMVQKETQNWTSDPAFIDAINSVMSGSPEVLATSVISLTKTVEKPLGEILSSGNGFRIERKFFRIRSTTEGLALVDPDRRAILKEEEILPGAQLHVGDRIRADYKIWNQENRSFVRLTAPREAFLRPVNQTSGYYGLSFRPMRIGDWFSFAPRGYRDVRTDRTYFYFDAYPEENSTISEEFFVTQNGAFTAPVVEIESLYAPHYRANAPASAPLQTM